MKYWNCLLACFTFFGQGLAVSSSTSPMKSLPMHPIQRQPVKPASSQPQAQPPPRPKLIIPPSERTIVKPMGELFSYPGMVMLKDDRWTGTDNFLNLPRSMAVQVNVVKPPNAEINLNSEGLTDKIIGVFQNSGLSIIDMGVDGKPPLPFYNMLIMVYPIEGGYAAAIVARLFEEVNLTRLRLMAGDVFQAITWTQANLVVAPTKEFEALLGNTIDSMADNFTRRVTAHQPEKAPEPEQLAPEQLIPEQLRNER